MASTPDAMRKVFVDGYVPWDARTDYMINSFLAGLPLIGSAMKVRDEMAYMDDYLSNRGLSYADILYPSRTGAYQATAGFVSYVSSNIERLYK